MNDELNMDELDRVTGGFVDRKTEILNEIRFLRSDLNNPKNSEQDKKVICDRLDKLLEELDKMSNQFEEPITR